MGVKLGTPRVRLPTAKPGEIIEIRTLVSHPMETGLRHEADGTLIPRDLIKRFEVRFEGELVFAADIATAVSANPFIAFPFKATRPGAFEFAWITDDDERTAVRAELKLA